MKLISLVILASSELVLSAPVSKARALIGNGNGNGNIGNKVMEKPVIATAMGIAMALTTATRLTSSQTISIDLPSATVWVTWTLSLLNANLSEI